MQNIKIKTTNILNSKVSCKPAAVLVSLSLNSLCIPCLKVKDNYYIFVNRLG